MARGYVFGWVFAITVGSLVVGFVIRWALKAVFRAEEMPRAEAFVDHWWVWAPLVTVVGGVWYYGGPVLGLLGAVGSVSLVRHWDRLYPAVQRRGVPYR